MGKEESREQQRNLNSMPRFSHLIQKITQVRTEYTSARLICSNLDHRKTGKRFERPPGHLPAEIDYLAPDGTIHSLSVRDYDVRLLDRIAEGEAIRHLELILQARQGHSASSQELKRRTREIHEKISPRFAGGRLIETDEVIPYTTSNEFNDTEISNKGSILLRLSRHGFATADFCALSSRACLLNPADLKDRLHDTIRNLEILSGRKLEDPGNPLLIAMRSAMPEYLPGFMPTYLNVGLTPSMIPGLPQRYGKEATVRIRLSNRKTILEALNPDAFREIENKIQPGGSIEENTELISSIEAQIEKINPRLLTSSYDQLFFFLKKIYEYYNTHLDALRNFMPKEIHFPTVIFQRMVCSVIDQESYAGVLYSRHPRLGTGVLLQFGRTIFGEDLMTGRLPAEERHFLSREDARKEFPAVYHFWDRLFQLEKVFRSPVMVEFTGVHGTFTILQVNPAELTGAGMITAVMDIHNSGMIDADRVRELIKPYHVRQIESDTIDPKSLWSLTPFCQGLSVLPRSAVTGKIILAGAPAQRDGGEADSDNIVLVKERFTPQDTIDMQNVSAICSLSPAAIHVVTTAQNLGIPALLNLEENGVRLDLQNRCLINREGGVIREGDWVTVSSRGKTLYVGKAVFAPARLLQFMAGEKVKLSPTEKPRFRSLARYYQAYRRILENVGVGAFESLQDLGHSILYGRLKEDCEQASTFVNQGFDVNHKKLVRRLFDVTLGTHLMNLTAYKLLTSDRQVRLLRNVLELCREKRTSGYQAGAFVIGSLILPEAPVLFWEKFSPFEVGALLNEWILHQKYLDILNNVGEQKISRARAFILSQGLGPLYLHKGLMMGFMTLKLSRVDLREVRQSLSENADPQTAEAVELLMKPFGEFFDFGNPMSLARLKKICDNEKVLLPRPENI